MAFHTDFLNTQDLQRLATKQRSRLMKKSQHHLHEISASQQIYTPVGKEKVRINISGKIFETFESTLHKKQPNIFTGNRCKKYYDVVNKEYVLDRNDKAFGAILTYFQSGLLAKPQGCSERFFINELRFYGLEKEAKQRRAKHLPHQAKRILPENKIQKFIWELFEYPDTSRAAKGLAIFSTIVILLSIIGFCVETLPSFNRRADPENQFTKDGRDVLFVVEAFCVVWFTLEYICRFIGSPRKIKFLYSPLNLVDIAAILPFYTALILKNSSTSVSSFAVLRILRLVRVFRVFKLSRYSKGLQLFLQTILASSKELLLLFFFMMIVLILYSSAVYYVESHDGSSEDFKSIPHTFWLAMVTITTVGYGDMVQETLGGKIIGSFLAVTGVLVIALPIPVIVNNFTKYYEIIMSPDNQQYDYENYEAPQQEKQRSSMDGSTEKGASLAMKDIKEVNHPVFKIVVSDFSDDIEITEDRLTVL